MISERTIRRWRLAALISNNRISQLPREGLTNGVLEIQEKNRIILKLTQELLDQILIRKVQ